MLDSPRYRIGGRSGFAEVDRAVSEKEVPCGYAIVLAGETEAQSGVRVDMLQYEKVSRPHRLLGKAQAHSTEETVNKWPVRGSR
jgi:hypothetical protein